MGPEKFQSGIVNSHKGFRVPDQFVSPIYKNHMPKNVSKFLKVRIDRPNAIGSNRETPITHEKEKTLFLDYLENNLRLRIRVFY